jgi:hypothetical protein
VSVVHDTLERYDDMRSASLQDAEERLRLLLDKSDLRLSGLSHVAISAWRGQWSGGMGWNWSELRDDCFSNYKRFDVAIWYGGSLCGLALGRPTRSKQVLKIEVVEGKPGRHILRGSVALCVLEAGLAYASLLGSRELRFIDPLPKALRTYRRLKCELPLPYFYPENPNDVDENLCPPYCFVKV